ncbi:sensor domain-containing diguanylate cyclase [Thermodesulfobacterium hydrogeniphilum]|uniref:sensor domain-containing diguanylate cyclase n=1 Tax=Thermodesulfobacterium hydrogeniphilum TaxID=161156 RepID=UPI0005702349|nr:diguanylate cyclase [Thermodesulfobacterium hydrogeniphilum]
MYKVKNKSLKTLHLIFITVLISLFFIFISYLLIYKLIVYECLKLEKIKIIHFIDDIEFFFLQKVKNLQRFCKNWTSLEKLNLILQNKSSNFVKYYITPYLFINNNIDLFLYLDLNGKPKIGGLYNKKTKKIEIPLDFKDLITKTIFNKKENFKLVFWKNKLFLLNICPIFINNATKSQVGYLLVGNFITQKDINSLVKLLKLKHFEIINSDKFNSSQIVFLKENLDEIKVLKPNFLGIKNFAVKITFPVDKNFIKASIYTIIITQIFLFLICAILIVKLINFFIIKPVLNLTKDVKKLTVKRSFIENQYSNEEINYLASIINDFLKEIFVKEKIYTILAEESENLILLFNEKREILYKNTKIAKYFKADELINFVNEFIQLSKSNKIIHKEFSVDNKWIKGYTIAVEKDLYLFIGYDITNFKKKEKELFEKAVYDSLTNLYNRRYFEDIFERIILASKRGERFVLLFIDCDDLKTVNDNYGHLVGDEVLKFIAKKIKETIRKEDIAARWGGDEFVVILYNCNKKDGIITAQRILRKIKSSEINISGIKIKTTVSIGLVEIDGTKESKEILDLADTLVYEAKESGRGIIKYY